MLSAASLLRAVRSELKRALSWGVKALDPLSKMAQIGALIIAGIWTYHVRQITGEDEINPEIRLTTGVTAYNQTTRLLSVRVSQKNVGKVPVYADQHGLSVILKRIPDGQPVGYLDMEKQPVLYKNEMLKRYDEGVELSPGAEYEDLAQFVVAPGNYYVEATLSLPNDEDVNGVAVQTVE
jgi:hypothetical protein